jgi:hypothetical membrane protein
MRLTISPVEGTHSHTTSDILTTATTTHRPRGRMTRWLALGAVAGSLLFELAWIVLGILQPATLTPYGVLGGISGAISNPISGLGVGPNAALFNLAFVLCGLLQLIGVVGVVSSTGGPGWGLGRSVSLVLLTLSPIGLAMAGIFTLESLLLHLVAALLLFVSPVLSFAATGLFLRGVPGWRGFGNWLLLLGSPLTLLLWIVYSASFDVATVAAGLGIAGLTERVLTLEVHAWFVALGWRAFRRS